MRGKLLLRGPYLPVHACNRMQSEGDVSSARKGFCSDRFPNLDYLLKTRFGWMNGYIQKGWRTVEIGAGAGFSEFYLTEKPVMTDLVAAPWIDAPLDATDMALPDRSIDCIIASHNIHHFPSPFRFFKECERVLKPGGMLLIQEIHTSLALRALLRLMRHEGWSYEVDVFDERAVANDPSDAWSANCAVPELLFEQVERFEKTFRSLKVERNSKCEFLIFPLSGGVISKTRVPALPHWLLQFAHSLDKGLIRLFPDIFAMGRSVAIRKTER